MDEVKLLLSLSLFFPYHFQAPTNVGEELFPIMKVSVIHVLRDIGL